MSGLYNLSQLDKNYQFLPLMPRIEGSKEKGTYKVEYLRTYPAYPWKAGTGDHLNDDPITFINLCADAGLVKWETAAERDARIEEMRKREAEERKRKREQ